MDILATLGLLHHQRELLTEQAMALLGTWALLNLLVSGYLVARTDRRTETHYFHQMNVGWNLINLLLAVVGILRAQPGPVAGLTLASSLQDQFMLEKILLLNAGLDVAYLCIGSWLRARGAGAVQRPERLLGFGRSLWLQGGFLLLFDVGFYFLYHRYAEALLSLVS